DGIRGAPVTGVQPCALPICVTPAMPVGPAVLMALPVKPPRRSLWPVVACCLALLAAGLFALLLAQQSGTAPKAKTDDSKADPGGDRKSVVQGGGEGGGRGLT